jgi:hypothetical protein
MERRRNFSSGGNILTPFIRILQRTYCGRSDPGTAGLGSYVTCLGAFRELRQTLPLPNRVPFCLSLNRMLSINPRGVPKKRV